MKDLRHSQERYTHLCRMALESYYHYGSDALIYLEKQQWEEAEKLLRRQCVSFHYFETYYLKNSEAGKNYLHQELQKLWENIEVQDREIIKILTEMKEDLRLQKASTVRAKIALENFLSEKKRDSSYISALI